MTRGGATSAILVGVMLVGFSASAVARPESLGKVKGHFREVGGSPAPGGPSTPSQPLRGHIYLRAHGHHVATFRAHRNGGFRGYVPPGRYHVFGRSPDYGHNKVRCPAAHPIHVHAGKVVHVAVSCQVP